MSRSRYRYQAELGKQFELVKVQVRVMSMTLLFGSYS